MNAQAMDMNKGYNILLYSSTRIHYANNNNNTIIILEALSTHEGAGCQCP